MTDKEKEAIKEIEYARSFGTSGILPRWSAIETALNLIQTSQEEIKKKDAVIGEMVSFIEVFELDDEIRETYCDGTLDNCKHKEDIQSCRACIKEYFINKVKKESKDE